jgi:hypothetical protein
MWRELSDSLLVEQEVTVIYHSVAIEVFLEGGERVGGAKVWTKEGPLEIHASVTVDASGDADLVAMAGFPSTIGDRGRVQNPTMIFRINGVDVDRFESEYGQDSIMPPEVSGMIEAANQSGKYCLPRTKIWLFPTTHPNQLLCNCTRIVGDDGRELNSLFYRDFTEAERNGRIQAREYARFFRDSLAGCDASWLDETGVQVGIRQTRQIDGLQTLSNADVTSGRKFRDGIARSPWPIELHSGTKPKVEWLLDDVYEIPYECFVPKKSIGLLSAGRCLSAEHEAVASARVTAQCFSYGHAIGHAAVHAIRENVAPHQIAGSDLRMILNKDGARLD